MGNIISNVMLIFVGIAMIYTCIVKPIMIALSWKRLSNIDKIILASLPVTVLFIVILFINISNSDDDFPIFRTIIIVFLCGVYIILSYILLIRDANETKKKMNKELFDKNRNLDSLRSKKKCLENEIKQLENENGYKDSIINLMKLIDNCYEEPFSYEKYINYNNITNAIKEKNIKLEQIEADIESVNKDIDTLNKRMGQYYNFWGVN